MTTKKLSQHKAVETNKNIKREKGQMQASTLVTHNKARQDAAQLKKKKIYMYKTKKKKDRGKKNEMKKKKKKSYLRGVYE